jgi:hypothetical protein
VSGSRRPYADMPLDAVRNLNPEWRCWREPVPMNGWYCAERDGYGRVSAADPEDLYTAILIAESHPVHPVPRGPGRHPSSSAQGTSSPALG